MDPHMPAASTARVPVSAAAHARPRTPPSIGLVLAAVIAVVCAAFAPLSPARAEPAPTQPKPLKAVATTGMIADLVSVVGGTRVSVVALMGEGVDPHMYKASPGDLRLMSEADIIFYNGLHLEGRMADAIVRMASRRTVVQVTDTIPESMLREPPEFEGQVDPHVWFDASIWALVVQRVRDALIEKDAASREIYAANADAYLKRLAEAHEYAKARMAAIPPDRRLLVTAHDAFGYFGRAYGLEVRGIQGISTDSEASLRDINALVDTLVERRVPAVFIETSVPRKTIDALREGCAAKGHQVVIGGELYSDALGAADSPAGTYLGMFRHNVDTIAAALGAPPVSPAPATPTPSDQGGR